MLACFEIPISFHSIPLSRELFFMRQAKVYGLGALSGVDINIPCLECILTFILNKPINLLSLQATVQRLDKSPPGGEAAELPALR